MVIDKRVVAAVFSVVTIVVCALLWFQNTPPKPRLALMSSIPLVLGEVSVQQMVAGDYSPAPAYKVLQQHYDITPLDNIDDRLSMFDLLLLTQIRSLSASELVRLDDWVRKGGGVVILSDAALQWPSEYSLGDKRRPSFTSFLSPLFEYWGVEQVLPLESSRQRIIEVGSYEINSVTVSKWTIFDKNKKYCAIGSVGFEAQCSIGNGRAILIADSDFIYDGYWTSIFVIDDNMAYLLDRLKSLSDATTAN